MIPAWSQAWAKAAAASATTMTKKAKTAANPNSKGKVDDDEVNLCMRPGCGKRAYQNRSGGYCSGACTRKHERANKAAAAADMESEGKDKPDQNKAKETDQTEVQGPNQTEVPEQWHQEKDSDPWSQHAKRSKTEAASHRAEGPSTVSGGWEDIWSDRDFEEWTRKPGDPQSYGYGGQDRSLRSDRDQNHSNQDPRDRDDRSRDQGGQDRANRNDRDQGGRRPEPADDHGSGHGSSNQGRSGHGNDDNDGDNDDSDSEMDYRDPKRPWRGGAASSQAHPHPPVARPIHTGSQAHPHPPSGGPNRSQGGGGDKGQRGRDRGSGSHVNVTKGDHKDPEDESDCTRDDSFDRLWGHLQDFQVYEIEDQMNEAEAQEYTAAIHKMSDVLITTAHKLDKAKLLGRHGKTNPKKDKRDRERDRDRDPDRDRDRDRSDRDRERDRDRDRLVPPATSTAERTFKRQPKRLFCSEPGIPPAIPRPSIQSMLAPPLRGIIILMISMVTHLGTNRSQGPS